MSCSLSLINLTKKFEKGTVNEKIALDNFSLEVGAGEFITILGSNGAGKSTLFNAILGNFITDSGRIILDGVDITFDLDYKRALNIGCLYQNPLRGTAPNMTIEENLALAYTRKSSKSFFAVNRKDTAVFREALAELNMGLEDRLKTKMGLLSGGQRQAASLLMATLAHPKLLLLDEHTAALDPAAAQKILTVTREIVARDKITTLMITHDMKYALSCGDRTVMMDAGRLVLDVSGEKRKALEPSDLVRMFNERGGGEMSDRTLLS